MVGCHERRLVGEVDESWGKWLVRDGRGVGGIEGVVWMVRGVGGVVRGLGKRGGVGGV